jgi:N-acetylneuraminic acid mutarotase
MKQIVPFLLFIAYWVTWFPGVPDSVAASGSEGSWTVGAPAPSKRTEVAVAELNGKIYVVGGFAEPDMSNALDYGITKAVEVYDPMTDSWTTATPLPEGRHHVGIASLGGFLYVVGGYSQSLFSVWEPVVTVYRYNPSTGRWEELTPMPTARGGLGVAVFNGHLYAIGGYNGKENPSAVEVFDPATNSWTTRAPLPTPRDHLAVATAESRIYVIGGREKGNFHKNLAVVEEYDPATNQWHSRADLPTARSGITAGVIDSRIYVLGGESGSGTFSNNETYIPGKDQWQTMAPMPTARHGLGSAVVGGRLFVISGGPTPGGSFSDKNEIFTPPIGIIPTSSRSNRTPAAHIGSVMAMLATLEDAQVLPPEGTPEADQLIHILIQLQSAFLKSSDPAVRTFFSEALAAYFFDGASEAERQFHQGGWNSRILEAVLLYEAYPKAWESPELDRGLAAYNVNHQNVETLQTTFDQARQAFLRQKRDIHDVYEIRRQQMPG